MKKTFILFLVLIILILFAIISYHRFRVQTQMALFSIFPIYSWVSVNQPVLFNHLRHKEVVNLKCIFCHRYAENYRVAGIPNIEVCRACHFTDSISKKPEAIKVVRYVQSGREIPWKRMYELPKFVVFPHWIHIRREIDCSVCHGVTGLNERPVKMVDRNYMDWCMDCHKKSGADTDCYTCHSS